MVDVGILEARVRRLEQRLAMAEAHSAKLFDRLLALQVGVSRVLVPLLIRNDTVDIGEWDRNLEELAAKQEAEAASASPDEAARLNHVGSVLRELALAPGLSAEHCADIFTHRRNG